MKPIAASIVGGMITSAIAVMILVPIRFAMLKERALRHSVLGDANGTLSRSVPGGSANRVDGALVTVRQREPGTGLESYSSRTLRNDTGVIQYLKWACRACEPSAALLRLPESARIRRARPEQPPRSTPTTRSRY